MGQRKHQIGNPIVPATLLIVPPFASVTLPCIGVHVLQSVARARGCEVGIFYSNLLLAGILGEAQYEIICNYPYQEFFGEHLMAWFAHGDQVVPQPDLARANREYGCQFTLEGLHAAFDLWRERVAQQVAGAEYENIGVSSSYEQTNASKLVLQACRAASPHSRLLIGGANCQGEMADGMAVYITELDHVFSGDSELAFADFLADPNAFAGQKIIRCPPNAAVDQLPPNDFSDFVRQLALYLPDSPTRGQLQLVYETSRGCWWGQKHHCTFCGLNGEGMGFREKPADKVLDELLTLKREYQAARVFMVDNIMPHSYFTTLLPMLAGAQSGLKFFYEQKSNIDLAKALLLRDAGVDRIQPGIEALHSESLRLMKKGVRAKQNIALMRYARALNIELSWNWLYGFPGEQEQWFAEVLRILPALEHLSPPIGVYQIIIDRFSPYFSSPEGYGLHKLLPHAQYATVFPDHPNSAQLAYHFSADSVLPTFADSALLPEAERQVALWRKSWQQLGNTPNLVVLALSTGQYLLIDSRSMHPEPQTHTLDHAQAAACLVEHQRPMAGTAWALAQGAAIEFDGAFLPLAIADVAVMLRFEQEFAAASPAAGTIPIRLLAATG
jgi:ribosomal peptide maturation radical SAM protein 1